MELPSFQETADVLYNLSTAFPKMFFAHLFTKANLTDTTLMPQNWGMMWTTPSPSHVSRANNKSFRCLFQWVEGVVGPKIGPRSITLLREV